MSKIQSKQKEMRSYQMRRCKTCTQVQVGAGEFLQEMSQGMPWPSETPTGAAARAAVLPFLEVASGEGALPPQIDSTTHIMKRCRSATLQKAILLYLN